MAIMQQNSEKSLLDVTPQDYYYDTMRPYLGEVYMKCRTDDELARTIDKVMNVSDSACAAGDLAQLNEAYDVLEETITDAHYFEGPMKKGREEEKELVRGLIEKIGDFRLIIKAEKPAPKPEEEARSRFNYREPDDSSPIGENMDYGSRNMRTLNEPNPKERIPNIN